MLFLEDEEQELRKKLLAKLPRKDKDKPKESSKKLSVEEDEMFSIQPGAQVSAANAVKGSRSLLAFRTVSDKKLNVLANKKRSSRGHHEKRIERSQRTVRNEREIVTKSEIADEGHPTRGHPETIETSIQKL